jgi:hypothetical protein
MQSTFPYNRYLFLTALVLFSCFCFYLFYYQAIDIFPSDLEDHINFTLIGKSTYSLLHSFVIFLADVIPITGKVSRLSHLTILMIITMVGSVLATILILHAYLHQKYKEANPYLIDFVAISLVIVSMLIIPRMGRDYLYLGIGTPNPWHNPTYLFCRPFSLIAFIALLMSYDKFKANASYARELVLLAVAAALSMWAKPSFMMSFLPALACLFLYKLIKKEVSLRYSIMAGLALLPSLVPLFIINQSVYQGEQATNKVVIIFGEVWYAYTDNFPLSILMGMAFPLYMLIVNYKTLSTGFMLAFINYIIATLIYFFLAEDGDRMYHGNFGWTYFFAMFFMFLMASEALFFKSKLHTAAKALGWLLFGCHLLSGVYYLSVLARGTSYA